MPIIPITRVPSARKQRRERSSRERSVSTVVAFLIMVAIVLGGVMLSNANYSSTAYDYRTRSPEGWSEDVRITVRPEGSDSEPAIAASGNKVHIVWTRAVSRVMYTNSSDAGETWSEFQQLSFDGLYSIRPAMAVSGDTIHVVWDDDGGSAASEVRYTRSTDGGNTWSEPMFISSDDGHNSQAPKIAVSEDGMDVHVVWVDSRHGSESSPPNTELYYNRSHDGGVTWEGEVRLTEAPYASAAPNIVVEASNVHLVWSDERAGKFDIYYRRSLDNGATWQDEIVLADGSNWEVGPDVAVWDGNVHVVWVEELSDPEYTIKHRKSIDGGGAWEPTQRMVNSNTSWVHGIDLEDNIVHVSFHDWRSGNNEVYYVNSTDNGITWNSDLRLTEEDGYTSGAPKIAVEGEKIHVVWVDRRDEVREIYYKRYPDFVSISEFNNLILPVITTLTIYIAMSYRMKKYRKRERGEKYEKK